MENRQITYHDCAYGEANRTLIEKYMEDFEKWKNNDFCHFKKYVVERLDRPQWFVTIILTILTSTVVGLIVYSINCKGV